MLAHERRNLGGQQHRVGAALAAQVGEAGGGGPAAI